MSSSRRRELRRRRFLLGLLVITFIVVVVVTPCRWRDKPPVVAQVSVLRVIPKGPGTRHKPAWGSLRPPLLVTRCHMVVWAALPLGCGSARRRRLLLLDTAGAALVHRRCAQTHVAPYTRGCARAPGHRRRPYRASRTVWAYRRRRARNARRPSRAPDNAAFARGGRGGKRRIIEHNDPTPPCSARSCAAVVAMGDLPRRRGRARGGRGRRAAADGPRTRRCCSRRRTTATARCCSRGVRARELGLKFVVHAQDAKLRDLLEAKGGGAAAAGYRALCE